MVSTLDAHRKELANFLLIRTATKSSAVINDPRLSMCLSCALLVTLLWQQVDILVR